MCLLLGVSSSGYYDWLERPESDRKLDDKSILCKIREIFEEHEGRYGSPRIHAELIHLRHRISRKRVERLMRENGLTARRPRRLRRTTLSEHDRRIPPNLVARNFTCERCDMVWVADLTYVWTLQGWLYLAVILDLASRAVIGWAAADHMRDELTLEALNSALARRGKKARLDGLVHHSDRGSQYASDDYIHALETRGIARSMSRKGDCWDNSVVESFFATLKKELVYRHTFHTKQQALDLLFEYIETYYNRARRHSTIEYLSPMTYETIRGNFL
jgi:putative transposase